MKRFINSEELIMSLLTNIRGTNKTGYKWEINIDSICYNYEE